MITQEVGSRLSQLRKERGISQEKFAIKAEIDRTYLAGVEQGKRNPSLKILEKIIIAFDISFHDFFEGM